MPPDPSPRPARAARRSDAGPAPPAPSRADRVARRLAADILEGRRPVGGDLPAEPDIAAAQGCSIATVRVALRELEALGLITRGRGTTARVVAGEVRARYAMTAQADGNTGDYLARTRLVIERQRRMAGDADLALLLDAPAAANWLRLSGRRMAMDAALGPLSCVDLWLATRAATLDLPEQVTPATLEALLGVGIVEVEEEIAAGTLTPSQARHLGTRGGTACLTVLRRYRRRGGTVVAALRDVHPADRAGVLVRLRRV